MLSEKNVTKSTLLCLKNIISLRCSDWSFLRRLADNVNAHDT